MNSPAARVLGRVDAAAYLGISVSTFDRMVAAGIVTQLQVPMGRAANGAAVRGESNRRVLFDRVQLDALVDQWRKDGER